MARQANNISKPRKGGKVYAEDKDSLGVLVPAQYTPICAKENADSNIRITQMFDYMISEIQHSDNPDMAELATRLNSHKRPIQEHMKLVRATWDKLILDNDTKAKNILAQAAQSFTNGICASIGTTHDYVPGGAEKIKESPFVGDIREGLYIIDELINGINLCWGRRTNEHITGAEMAGMPIGNIGSGWGISFPELQ
jgi:hypothetical protein